MGNTDYVGQTDSETTNRNTSGRTSAPGATSVSGEGYFRLVKEVQPPRAKKASQDPGKEGQSRLPFSCEGLLNSKVHTNDSCVLLCLRNCVPGICRRLGWHSAVIKQEPKTSQTSLQGDIKRKKVEIGDETWRRQSLTRNGRRCLWSEKLKVQLQTQRIHGHREKLHGLSILTWVAT